VLINGFAANPLLPSLAVQGLVGNGVVTKTGAGVLQFNAQSVHTGAVNVNAGGIAFGTLGLTGSAGSNQPGSRFASYAL